jgi:FkbM family methyltransferase
VDVGANDPVVYSVTYAFYQQGWRGITIDPMHAYAEKLRAERPGDLVVEAAVSDDPSGSVTLHQIADSGLSTLLDDVGEGHRSAGFTVEDVIVPARRLDDILQDAGWDGLDIHLMVIDTEGAEKSVLNTIDLRRWRPWVMVVEATRPLTTEQSHESWEPILLEAGYQLCLFDGLSRFYVSQEKADELAAPLSVPANVLDDYTEHSTGLREQEIQRLLQATTDLNAALDAVRDERDGLAAEKEALVADNHGLAAARDETERSARERDRRNADEILRWRTAAIRSWAKSLGGNRSADVEQLHSQIALHLNHIRTTDAEVLRLRQEVQALHRTLSWRVTKPLRLVRGISRRSRP